MTLAITPSFVQTRRNPTRIREMNLRLVQGEALFFNPVIWVSDTDTVPADVSTVTPMLSVFRDRIGRQDRDWGDGMADYGWGYDFSADPILQYTGALTGSPGQFSFLFAPTDTAALGGRYRFYVFNGNPVVTFVNGVTVYATGILEIDGCAYAQPGLLGIQPIVPVQDVVPVIQPDGQPGAYFVPS